MGMLAGGFFGQVGEPAVETLRLDTDITSSTFQYGTQPSTKREYSGFDAGADLKGNDSFGSIADGTYDDGASVARVVTAFYFNLGGQGSNNVDSLWLAITSNPDDSDVTFTKVIIDGVTHVRTDAAATGLSSGARWWRWDAANPDPFLGANPDPFELWALV